MSSEAIFSLDNISFAYDTGSILFDGASFALHKGDRVGFWGANGVGKTSFFRLITGLLVPSAGEIFFRGQRLETEKQWRQLRCEVGYILQQSDDQLFCPTVLDDVAFGPLNMGLSPHEVEKRVARVLQNLGLEGYENRLIHTLSGGEKRLVCLATILVMEPSAILLDEPTNDLDNNGRQRVLDILCSLSIPFIVISHDLDFLFRTVSRFMTIEKGKISFLPPPFPHALP